MNKSKNVSVRFQLCLVIIALLITNVLAYSQDIITDRPDQTESSSTVGKKNIQIESGILLGFTGEGTASAERQILAPTTLFRLGVVKGFELRVVNQFESLKVGGQTTEGISDWEVGFKVQLLQKEGVNTEIALLSHLVMPTGSTGLSADEWGTVNKLCLSHELSDNLGLSYNVGYNYFGDGKGDLTYSLALGIGLSDKTAVYVEPYGELADFDDFSVNVDAGVTYLLKPNCQADLSFGTGLDYTMNYLSLGISWLIRSKNGKVKMEN